MRWVVKERHDGRVSVLYETDDEADALKERDWQRDQWSDQSVARQCVWVERTSPVSG